MNQFLEEELIIDSIDAVVVKIVEASFAEREHARREMDEVDFWHKVPP